MFTHKLICASLVLAFTSSPTVGAPGHLGPSSPFLGPHPESIDNDGDGRASREEIQMARTAEFESIDTASGGSLSLTELARWTAAKVAGRFEACDTDASGSLSSEEFTAGRTGRHATIATNLYRLPDKNSDGQL